MEIKETVTANYNRIIIFPYLSIRFNFNSLSARCVLLGKVRWNSCNCQIRFIINKTSFEGKGLEIRKIRWGFSKISNFYKTNIKNQITRKSLKTLSKIVSILKIFKDSLQSLTRLVYLTYFEAIWISLFFFPYPYPYPANNQM